jgi:fido (protein-threonine AMPylation protein)
MTDYPTAELALRFWESGHTLAEELAADLLSVDGFTEIVPQAPKGGPDGGKDILCDKAGISYVVAVHFPRDDISFQRNCTKFKKDIVASLKYNRQGFVFVTNQHFSSENLRTLAGIAESENKELFIVHRERIRNILNSPAGYGIRAHYLRIPLNPSEQFSYFSDEANRMANALEKNTAQLTELTAQIKRVLRSQKQVLMTLATAPISAQLATPASPGGALIAEPLAPAKISATISPELILAVHRIHCGDLPARMVGRLRTTDVVLRARDGSGRTGPTLQSAAEVPRVLTLLCEEWRDAFPATLEAPHHKKLMAVAEFHGRFLKLHPFLDGNGRAARALLMLQCLDLFESVDMTLMDRGTSYMNALKAADSANYKPLTEIISVLVPKQA